MITSFFSIFFYFLNRALKSEEKILIGHLTVKKPPDLSKSIQYEQYYTTRMRRVISPDDLYNMQTLICHWMMDGEE